MKRHKILKTLFVCLFPSLACGQGLSCMEGDSAVQFSLVIVAYLPTLEAGLCLRSVPICVLIN